MPFQKGNTLWKAGLPTRKANKEKRLDVFFGVAADGGADEYANKLDKLARGLELSKPEMEFMNRYENLFEYMKAKRAREDSKGQADVGNTVNITVKDSKTAEDLNALL